MWIRKLWNTTTKVVSWRKLYSIDLFLRYDLTDLSYRALAFYRDWSLVHQSDRPPLLFHAPFNRCLDASSTAPVLPRTSLTSIST